MIARLKRILKLSFFLFLLAHFSYSQKCATTYRDSLALIDNPSHLKVRQQRINQFASSNLESLKSRHTVVYIPTVVHVIHTSPDGEISDDPNIGNISEEQTENSIKNRKTWQIR